MEYSEEKKEDLLSLLWARIFPFWPVFLVLVLFSLLGAWLYIQYRVPLYESSATVLIKDEKKGTEDSKVTESLDLLSSKKIIENEIEVLKSRAILTQTVNDLKLYASVYQHDRWRSKLLYKNSPVKIEVQNPDLIKETERVNFTVDKGRRQITLNGRNYPVGPWVATPWGTIRFSFNDGSQVQDAELFFTLVHPKRVVQSIGYRLNVSSVNKLASVINLKLKDEVPRRSEDILNTIIDIYDKASVNDKNSLANSTLSFLDERLKLVSGDLNSIEKQLQQYRANKSAIDLPTQGKLFLENVSENDQKIGDVDMKLAILNQVEQFLFSNDTRNGLVPTSLGFDEPVLTGLLNKLYDLELQSERLKGTTGENNPQLKSIADQIEKIKPNILENIRSQKKSMELKRNSLYASNSSYNSMLESLPQQEKDIVGISREQNIKSGIYSYLLQKREETALSHSSISSDSRILDRAEYSLDPVGLSNKLIYLVAVMIALGLGVAAITLLDVVNPNVLFRKDIESVTSLPIIGEIAYEKSKKPIVFESGNDGFIADQFRMLRTSLTFSDDHAKCKKILVTSTISSEGKSFIASNLGLSLSLTGKRVVLVDFDLTNPSLAQKIQIKAEKGVSDFLYGEVDLRDIVKNSHENANLFLISAGKRPSSSSDLIVSERSSLLLKLLEEKFDYIIMDTAPIGLLSDGYILSKQCDVTLFVIRHRRTPKKRLEHLINNYKMGELKNLMIVFNGIKQRGFASDKYGYGYDYNYVSKAKV